MRAILMAGAKVVGALLCAFFAVLSAVVYYHGDVDRATYCLVLSMFFGGHSK